MIEIKFTGDFGAVEADILQFAARFGLRRAADAHVTTLAPADQEAFARAIDAVDDDPGLKKWMADGLSIAQPKPVEERVAAAIASNEPVKRHRRTKAEMEAARAAEAAAEEVTFDDRNEPAETLGQVEVAEAYSKEEVDAVCEAPALTFDDVKAVLKDVLETDGVGVEGGRKLLQGFGIKKLSELNQAEYRLFAEKARALIGGAK